MATHAYDLANRLTASVIKDEPDWDTLPSETSRPVGAVLRHCLTKDPRRRLHDVADARLLLEESGETEVAAVTPEGPLAPRWRERLAWLVAAVALGVAAATVLWGPGASAPDPLLTRFSVTLPEEQPLALADVPIMALSRDGRSLAFAAVDAQTNQPMIFLRELEQTEPRIVPGTEEGKSPFFSPDGRFIAFFADGRLKKIPVGGGPATALAEAPTSRGGVWAEDGSILYSPEYTSGVFR